MQRSNRTVNVQEIDGNCILALPESFMSKFFNNVDLVMSVVIVPWIDHLRIYPLGKWETFEQELISAALSGTPEHRREMKHLMRTTVVHACECEIDDVGQIDFPFESLKFCGLQKNVVESMCDDYLKLQ